MLHCASTILWLNATAPLPKKFYMLTCGSASGLMIAGFHTFSQPWLAWFKITCSKKSCGIVNQLTSAVLSWTLERDTWIFKRLNLMATHVSATAKCEGVHYLQERLWQLILLTAFPNTYVPWPPTRCYLQCCPFSTACPHPPLWDCDMEPQVLPCLWFVWSWRWCPKWAACQFSLHDPHVVFLRRRFASLFSETRVQDVFAFLHQNNNKLHFFLHELIAFYEQASSRAYWPFLVNLVNLVEYCAVLILLKGHCVALVAFC